MQPTVEIKLTHWPIRGCEFSGQITHNALFVNDVCVGSVVCDLEDLMKGLKVSIYPECYDGREDWAAVFILVWAWREWFFIDWEEVCHVAMLMTDTQIWAESKVDARRTPIDFSAMQRGKETARDICKYALDCSWFY